MGDKSTQKKQYIIAKAGEVFASRGYKDVTMKDVVEACGISRGGLYLYYANTTELFEAVLEEKSQENRSIFEASEEDDATPGDKLLLYLDICKKALLNKDSLTTAIYEYLFANQGDNPVKKQLEGETAILEQIIAEGVEQEWMVCDDPKAAAGSITYTIEGLKIASVTTGITEEKIDKTIEYIMGTLGLAVE